MVMRGDIIEAVLSMTYETGPAVIHASELRILNKHFMLLGNNIWDFLRLVVSDTDGRPRVCERPIPIRCAELIWMSAYPEAIQYSVFHERLLVTMQTLNHCDSPWVRACMAAGASCEFADL